MSKIKFIESSHRYTNDKDEDLISVSKFFEQFKQKQDWYKIAQAKSFSLRRQGIYKTAEELLKEWDQKKNLSAGIGTIFHTIMENKLIDEQDPIFYNKVCKTKTCEHHSGAKYSIPITNLENDTVYPELMIYNLDYMICGQSDKVIITDKKINIWDYKTDKEIKFEAFSNARVKPLKLLKPLGHLDDCNGNHYAIKMSMYMYLLWLANDKKFKPGEIVIEHAHLKRHEETGIPMLDAKGKPIVLKFEQIKLPYLKKEVMAMLKTIKKK